MVRCAGVDWAKEEHAVCVLDEDGLLVEEGKLAHDERGIARTCALLNELGVGHVAIERPDGILVERLLEAGLVVLAIHPNQLKAARPRFRAAGGKSDAFDAFCLAELARTDRHRFRQLNPDSDETKALRALTRAREDLVQTRVALTNRLRSELESFWPGSTGVFADLDSPIALAFLERYPSPQDARRLGEKRLSAFLARNRYCGRKEASELLGRLREAPRGRAGRSRRKRVGRSSWRWSPPCARSSSRSGCSIRRSPTPCASIPTARSSSRSSAIPGRPSPPLVCSPRSATAGNATQPGKRWPPTRA